MTYRLPVASSNARITGAIASYMARVSSQSRMRLASLWRPARMLQTFGLNTGPSSTAKQSSIYAVCCRRRRDIRVRRWLTNIAIARANSWADSSCPINPDRGCSIPITQPPHRTGEFSIPISRVGKSPSRLGAKKYHHLSNSAEVDAVASGCVKTGMVVFRQSLIAIYGVAGAPSCAL